MGETAAATAGGLAASLLVAELFGPTIQGEGPSAGHRAMFLRLSRCNLSCSWCDTPYTWDTRRFDLRLESRRRTATELAAVLLSADVDLVVVTGGEPLLQQGALTLLVADLRDAGRRVEIETNGTVVPAPGLVATGVVFNVSAKLTHAGDPLERRIVPAALRALAATGTSVFKFVSRDLADLDEIEELVDRFGLTSVWVMPEGTSSSAVVAGLRMLADPVIARGWDLSSRLHVLAWGDVRGR